jgi:cation transport ATPase
MDPVRAGDARRALGGLAVLRAWLGLAQDPQPQHVHPDRDGTGVAWIYSVVATLAPQLFPPAFRGEDGMVAVYFEAAAVITVLVLLGQMLELRARERTSGAIKALLNLAPKTARRIGSDGSEGNQPRSRCGRRPPACASRREGAGRRRGRGRPLLARRVDGHR